MHRNVIERFAERHQSAHISGIDLDEPTQGTKHHLHRFLRMVATRRQQILERMLMDEE